jgi:hypothetical protein
MYRPIKAGKSFVGFLHKEVDPQKWGPFVAAARFVREPSKSSLHDALNLIADSEITMLSLQRLARVLPWPISCLIAISDSKDDVRSIASRARNGEFGDSKDWFQAELRWRKNGATYGDFEHCVKTGTFVDKNIKHVGFPPAILFQGTTGRQSKATFDAFRSWFSKSDNPRIKEYMANCTLGIALWSVNVGFSEIDPLLDWSIQNDDAVVATGMMFTLLSQNRTLGQPSVDYLDRVGRLVTMRVLSLYAGFRYREPQIETLKGLIALCAKNLEKRGLLVPLFYLSSEVDVRALEELKALPEAFLKPEQSDTASMRFCATVLALLSNRVRDGDYGAHVATLLELSAESEVTEFFFVALDLAARMRSYDDVARQAIAKAAASRIGRIDAEPLLKLLKTFLDAKHTLLDQEQCWLELGLPAAVYKMLIPMPTV